jgi:hypothetical protein
MTSDRRTRRWIIRGAGIALVLLLLALVSRYWHPVYGFTALIQLDASNDNVKIAAFRELPVYVHRETGGYDGLYYAQIAYHPSLDAGELGPAMDNFAYRARRILPPALAWLLAAGQPRWIANVYALLNVFAWLGLAALLWRKLKIEDARGLLAWAGVLFSAGALASVRLALTDLVALTIIALAIFAAERGRKVSALGSVAVAALARETSLLSVAALWKSPWFSWKNVARSVLALLPLAAWLGYVRWRVGPADQGWDNFTVPVVGFIEKWRAAIGAIFTVSDHWLAWGTVLATLGLTTQALFFLARPQLGERWWRLGAVYAGMMFCLGTAVWEGFPGAATRVLLPMTLAFNILANRTRAAVAWLVFGNLTVLAGPLAFRDPPQHPNEVATLHAAHVNVIASLGDGWYQRENTSRHAWNWTSRRGTLQLEVWAKTPQRVELSFGSRSPVTRTVMLRQDGREIWHAKIIPTRTNHVVTFEVTAGRSTLEFSTDTPPLPGNVATDARELAFTVYDERLDVAER